MLSAKSQYAVLALLELTQGHAEGRPAAAARIAERHGIPATFLVQILHELKRAGLVASTRGPSGGYRLNQPPADTTLAQIVDVLEAVEPPSECAANDSPFAGALTDVCQDLARSRQDVLAGVTLADLVERGATAPVWCI